MATKRTKESLVVRIRIDKYVANKLTTMAKEDGRTRINLIQKILREYTISNSPK